MLAARSLKQEGLPLLVSVVPIAVLAVWCFARLAYHPPQPGQAVTVRAHFPAADVGRIAHMVPQPGMTAPEGWVKEVEAADAGGVPYGLATWVVEAKAGETAHPLIVRYGEEEYRHDLLVGQNVYIDPIKLQRGSSTEHALEVVLEPVKLFGLVPGIPAVGFPPWLVAYLLITIPFVPILKRVLRIY
jgi:hypothetical protein